VIAAVNGFCVGGGIGLVGNADVIVAADDATFGLPEVDRGALGAATHLSRLVPQHKMRAMVYTSATATAQELHAFGSVLEVVPQAELRDAAFRVAEADRGQVAHRDPGGQGVAQRHRPVGREAQRTASSRASPSS
jgi:enoyl-CoA hydratase